MVKVTAPTGALSVLTCTANQVLKQLPNQKQAVCREAVLALLQAVILVHEAEDRFAKPLEQFNICFPFETAQ